jgi:hypothetical protein
MRLLPSRRAPTETDDSTRQLAAALYAGGERADAGVAFLVDRMSDTFRRGGDLAIELLLDWMDILMEGNKETATKFYVTVLPMLPAETRKTLLGPSASHTELVDEEFDPVIQPLISKIVIGGKGGAEALTTIFNALEKVKGAREAQATVGRILSQLAPKLRASMMPYLPDLIKHTLPNLRKDQTKKKNTQHAEQD